MSCKIVSSFITTGIFKVINFVGWNLWRKIISAITLKLMLIYLGCNVNLCWALFIDYNFFTCTKRSENWIQYKFPLSTSVWRFEKYCTHSCGKIRIFVVFSLLFHWCKGWCIINWWHRLWDTNIGNVRFPKKYNSLPS